MIKNITSKQGSIALISMLIISAFTLALVLIASESSVSIYEEYLNDNSDQIMYYTAEGCLEEAILRLEDDIDFTTGTVTLDADTTCEIAIAGTETEKTATISVTYLDYSQMFQADLEFSESGEIFNSNLTRWTEIQNINKI